MVSFLAREGQFSFVQNIQTDSGAHPTSCGYWNVFSQHVKWLVLGADSSSPTLLRLWMGGAIPPFHHIFHVIMLKKTEELSDFMFTYWLLVKCFWTCFENCVTVLCLLVKSRLNSCIDSILFFFPQVNALLPSNMFLLVIRGLFNHKLPTVRRKAMELLNTRLQHQGSFFSTCNRETLYSLLTPLLSVMGSIGSVTVKPDLETNQQVAMLSVKLLARHLAPENPSQFKQVSCCSVSRTRMVINSLKH